MGHDITRLAVPPMPCIGNSSHFFHRSQCGLEPELEPLGRGERCTAEESHSLARIERSRVWGQDRNLAEKSQNNQNMEAQVSHSEFTLASGPPLPSPPPQHTHLTSIPLPFLLSLVLRDSDTPGLVHLDTILVAGSDLSPSDMHSLTHTTG